MIFRGCFQTPENDLGWFFIVRRPGRRILGQGSGRLGRRFRREHRKYGAAFARSGGATNANCSAVLLDNTLSSHKPRPVPTSLLVVKNGSKILLRCLRVMPAPVSAIVTRTPYQLESPGARSGNRQGQTTAFRHCIDGVDGDIGKYLSNLTTEAPHLSRPIVLSDHLRAGDFELTGI